MRMRGVVHVELEHSRDEQLRLHDCVSDQPKVLVFLGRLDGTVQGAMHDADQVPDVDWLILDLGGQVDRRGSNQLGKTTTETGLSVVE